MEEVYRGVLREWLAELRKELARTERRIAELRQQGYSPIRPCGGPILLKAESFTGPAPESEELYKLENRRPIVELRVKYLEDRVR